MKARIVGLVSALVVTFVAAPAFAAEYYVVLDSKAKKCLILDAKPTSAEMTVLADAGNNGDKMFFTSKDAAEGAMHKMAACK